jgi:hypothetical protein
MTARSCLKKEYNSHSLLSVVTIETLEQQTMKMFSMIRGYDHNFRRIGTIFGGKIVVFLKNQCYYQIFSKFIFVLSQKRQFFATFFSENI